MTTPMMQQWHSCKEKAKDALLFFRLGDFYEAFYDDAVLIAKEADLTLTKRQNVPMAGIPYHASATYIDRLIAKGYKIAIAEQLEEAGKGLVKREIVRTITPGTQLQSSLLEERQSNFIACYVPGAAAFLDVTTAQFITAQTAERDELEALFCKFRPSEILFSQRHIDDPLLLLCRHNFKTVFSPQDPGFFDEQSAHYQLKEHFKVFSLDGLGFKNRSLAAIAAGALLSYLSSYLNVPLKHIHKVAHHTESDLVFLDRTTQNNLELVISLHDESKEHTLLHILDKTATPMGSRLLKQWLLEPLSQKKSIDERLDAVETLTSLGLPLSQIRDIERLTMRITAGFNAPRDLVSLKSTLQELPLLKQALVPLTSPLLQRAVNQIKDFSELTQKIDQALLDECPLKVGDGPLFKPGYSPELDTLYAEGQGSKEWLLHYQNLLRSETGIKSLKVGFTNAFGYFIDVSQSHSSKVPPHFQKRQTLVSSERFITPELKAFEQKALTSEERITRLETELLEELRQAAAHYSQELFQAAAAIAEIDCLQSLALSAVSYGYVRPLIHEGFGLDITEGRHPVIEQTMTGGLFTPNCCHLSENKQLMIIAGPNMGGKSTYIRQVALITLMAHVGSFVPAKAATIGLVDKIFTRIGASDDLSRGQSTFMVEMTETAHILNMATDKSLVILDEIGRGTSTFDGIAIAWSVAEFLLTEKRAKTLFATHYFELTKIEKAGSAAFNAHVAVQESRGCLFFLHRILPGAASRSFGIQVAELAGLPATVIARAKEIQTELTSLSPPAPAGDKKEPPLLRKKTKTLAIQTELPLFDVRSSPL